jgi:hypothetical protein
MLNLFSLQRGRKWIAFVLMLAALIGVTTTGARSARADEPAPDPIGAYQMTPTPMSVPGYTKPDP